MDFSTDNKDQIERLKNGLFIEPSSSMPAGGTKIHFLNTGFSDAILLESLGRFALIDAAEDSDNPRGFPELELEGYEDRVLDYLKTHAKSKDGKVRLDFIVGTHSHSDHIGGFDTIISDSEIEIDRAYLKKYDASVINKYEREKWDNQEVYDQMAAALKAKGVPVIQNMDSAPFFLGEMKITLFNTDDPPKEKNIGENDRSLGVLVESGGIRVFLAGDINDKSGDEKRLGPKIGAVDILKVGHHSYAGSTTEEWLKNLCPKVCIVTNNYKTADKSTLKHIIKTAGSAILLTGEENGIIAEFGENGALRFFNELHGA